MTKLSDRLMMAWCGEPGDTVQFAEFIAKNIQLYKMRNGYELSPRAAAHFTRSNLADSLRSRSPYQVNLMMGGYDAETGPELYWTDYLATMSKVKYGAHGYGAFFSLSIMDANYREDMTREEAMALLTKCVDEIQHRFLVSMPAFKVVVIDKEGSHDMPDVSVLPPKHLPPPQARAMSPLPVPMQV